MPCEIQRVLFISRFTARRRFIYRACDVLNRNGDNALSVATTTLITYCATYFALWEGGKLTNPRELTEVSDRGEATQPTHPQREI